MVRYKENSLLEQISEIRFGTWVYMLSPFGKNILRIPKSSEQNLAWTSQHSMCARKVSHKTDIFCNLYKKTEKVSLNAFLTPKFVFYTRHKNSRFLVKRLREPIRCRDVHAKLLSKFCTFKYVWCAILKPGASKHRPQQISSIRSILREHPKLTATSKYFVNKLAF